MLVSLETDGAGKVEDDPGRSGSLPGVPDPTAAGEQNRGGLCCPPRRVGCGSVVSEEYNGRDQTCRDRPLCCARCYKSILDRCLMKPRALARSAVSRRYFSPHLPFRTAR